MSHLLLLALMAPALAAAPPAHGELTPGSPSLGSGCEDDRLVPARQAPRTEMKRLGELPSGALVLTVLRKENDCVKPVIVRQGFGQQGDADTAGLVPESDSRRR